MLNNYLNATQRLLQNPGAPTTLYSTADLTTYINTARGQLAGEAECIRTGGVVNMTVGQRGYTFSSIVIAGGPSVTGIEGAIHVRAIRLSVGTGFQWVTPRAWEWFDRFYLCNPDPSSGQPRDWSQYSQGSAGTGTGSSASGSFFVDPLPDAGYQLICDCVCYPQPLASDVDIEALPYLWTDAVPYFAAYLALMGSQVSTRVADAQRMMQLYTLFVSRARKAANPSLDPWIYEQANDQASMNAYGNQQQGAAQ